MPVAEWIALIRKLDAEGKHDAATKELARFRAAYRGEAEGLLPTDLRARIVP